MTISDLIKYSPTDQAIALMADRYMQLTVNGVDDKEGFDAVHEARMDVKAKRVDVEKKRKELKKDALEYGRMVDAKAKRITVLLETIETHLLGQERIVLEEKERIKREAEEAKAAKIKERLESFTAFKFPISPLEVAAMSDEEYSTALGKAEEAYKAKLAEEAETKRLAAEEAARMQAERDRLIEEARKLEAERQRLASEEAERQKAILAEEERQRKAREAEEAKRRADREALEAERRAIEEEKRKHAEALERERLAKEAAAQLERDKAEAAERARIETEQRIAKEKAEAEARAKAEEEERQRQESLRPDREKLLAVVTALDTLTIPDVSPAMAEVRTQVQEIITAAANKIRRMVAKA